MMRFFLYLHVFLLCGTANCQNFYADSVFQILSEHTLYYKDIDESVMDKLQNKYPFDVAQWQKENQYVVSLEYHELPCERCSTECHKEWILGEGMVKICDTIYYESLCKHLVVVNRTEGKEDFLFISSGALTGFNAFIHECKRHQKGTRFYDTLNYVSDLKIEFSSNMGSQFAPGIYYERYWQSIGAIVGLDRFYESSADVPKANLRNTNLFTGLRLYFNSLDIRILKGLYFEYGVFGCLIGMPNKSVNNANKWTLEREFGMGWRGGGGLNFHLKKHFSLNLGVQYRKMFGDNKTKYDGILIGNVASQGRNVGPVFNLSVGYRFNHQ